MQFLLLLLLLLHQLESELVFFSISVFLFLSGKNYGVGSLWWGLLMTLHYIYMHLLMKKYKSKLLFLLFTLLVAYTLKRKTEGHCIQIQKSHSVMFLLEKLWLL